MVLPNLKTIEADDSVHFENELMLGLDLFELFSSGTLLGFGVSKGRSDPVIVIHGFLTTDGTTKILRDYLTRIGYKVYRSGIGANIDCISEAVRMICLVAEKAQSETGKKCKIIGHSLGGIIARSAVATNPQLFDSVITLGTPINGAKVTPKLLSVHGFIKDLLTLAGRPKNCFTPNCTCEAVQAVSAKIPDSVYHDSIYTETDGVVSWECCLEDEETNNHKVHSTHSGLVFNREVFYLLTKLLGRTPLIKPVGIAA